MSLPFSTESEMYLERLREFRDRALEASHDSGRIFRLGNFTVGIASARWKNDNGESVILRESTIRHGLKTVNPVPTKLTVTGNTDDGKIYQHRYEMNIDDIGLISAFESTYDEASYAQIFRADAKKLHQTLTQNTWATEAQREDLYYELERGASGLYIAR